MSEYLQKIVYLSQEDYNTLAEGGTAHGETGLHEDWIYLTENGIGNTDLSEVISIANGGTGLSSTTAHYAFVGPTSGTGAPSWRLLQAADLPDLDWSKITTGKPTTLSGYGITDAASSTHNHDGTYIKTISSTTENAIVRFDDNNGVKNSIVTIDNNGDITINGTAGSAPSLIFQRGTLTDSYTDWKIVDTSGRLSFQSKQGSAIWTERASFADNSGNFTITGTMTASSFSGSGSELVSIPAGQLTGTISMDRIAAEAIAPAKLDSTSTITIGTQAIKVGSSFTTSTLVTDLGLSKALRFIGTVASNSSYTPSDGTSGKPTITGLSSYTPVIGDVVLDSNNDEEYVCISVSGTTYTWELLGRSGSWAPSDHTHNISLTATGTATINLSSNTAYTLTAGGSSIIFKTPADTTYSVVSKTANGLCPQLPNETTTTKFLRQDGSWQVPSYPTSFSITANATDGLWDLTGTSGTNAVTYAVGAYSAKQSTAAFYTAATDPTLTTRLNYDGYFYATQLYSNGEEVLTSHNNLVKQTEKTNTDSSNYKLLASAQVSPTSGMAYDAVYNTKIYMDPSESGISAGQFTIHDDATSPVEKVWMKWNSTDQSLDFIFA